MGTNSFIGFLLIGVTFGVIAALMAFLITFEEYKKHFLGGNRPFKEAIHTALITFAIFLGLAIIVGYLLYRKIF